MRPNLPQKFDGFRALWPTSRTANAISSPATATRSATSRIWRSRLSSSIAWKADSRIAIASYRGGRVITGARSVYVPSSQNPFSPNIGY